MISTDCTHKHCKDSQADRLSTLLSLIRQEKCVHSHPTSPSAKSVKIEIPEVQEEVVEEDSVKHEPEEETKADSSHAL